jgi:D-alanyl-D-alanine carboxypeptidase
VGHPGVGSNTKTMTGTIVLQLAQEGKLKLDDPVSKYRSGIPNGDAITIAQLLEMRSGLKSYTHLRSISQAMDETPSRAWTAEELVQLGIAEPTDPPGGAYEYSNTNVQGVAKTLYSGPSNVPETEPADQTSP